MSEPENLTLVFLRRIDEKVDRAIADLHDLKGRMAAIEENLVGVQRRIDRLELRMERVERRLDLVDHSA